MEISAFSHPSVDYLVGQVDCLVVVLVEQVAIELVADFVQVAFELVAGFVDLIYLFFTNLNHQKVSQKITFSFYFPLLVDYLVEKVDCLVVVLVERVVIERLAELVQVAFELAAVSVDLKYLLLLYLYFHLSFPCLFSQTNLKIIDPRINFFW
jgi:phage-related holin